MTGVKFSWKKAGGIIAAALIIALSHLIPRSEGLGRDGITALAILLAAVVLWVMDTFPAGVTGLLALTLMIIFGITTTGSAFSGLGSNSVAFTISVFSLTIILVKSNLGYLITGLMLKWAKADSKKLILAFMMSSAILSSVMSNIAVAATFMGIAYTILDAINAKPGQSNFGRSIMLGIAVAAVNGGMGTPAGSSLNIVALGLLEQITGRTITFLQWTMVGYPFMLVVTPICWFFIVSILKPEQIDPGGLDSLNDKINEIKTLSAFDKKVMVFLIGLPVLWVAGNWVPVLNVTVVSIIGMTCMFLPGVDLLSWDEFQKGVPWSIVLMMGAVISLGTIVGNTGGTEFIVNFFLNSDITSLNPYIVLFLAAAFAYFLHTVLPVGPAILTLFFLPMIGICEGAGISASVPAMMLAFIMSGNYLLPVNPNLMVTYSSGYYTARDVFITGIVPSIAFLVLFTFWTPFMAGVLGI